MQLRPFVSLALVAGILSGCGSGSNAPRAVPAPPATNQSGTPVTAVITARFDPSTGVIPQPNNLAFSGTTDLTLNPPVANPNNFGDPAVAVSALDGWSTTAPWSASFSSAINPASLRPGVNVRVFQVTLTGPGGAVTGITRELSAPGDFVVALQASDTSNRTLVIVPTRPLASLTSYMAVLTRGIQDTAGNDATPDTAYFLAKRTTPLATGVGTASCASTDPIIPTANACALEPLRQLVNASEAAAASRGINRDDIVLSWVMTTQSVPQVLAQVRSQIRPTSSTLARTPLNISVAGLPPIADIVIGVTALPYYLGTPGAGSPAAPASVVLTGFWQARPGGYVPPFNTLGLSPLSTNVTFANPFPVATSTQNVPVLITVPNANSGQSKPAAGWPVVIFQHGITRNRSDALAISATFAQAGWAVVAIDQPLHGVGPTNPFYIENTPFGPIASERTFDVDLINNQTGASGPDGRIDDSGAHFINLASLLTSRDNLRQAIVDLSQLAVNIPRMDFDGDGTPDFDGSRIAFVGQSLGGIVGTGFMAVEPTVNVGVLNVPGGGLARLLEGSPTFGPRIRAGLAALGVQAGTPAFDQFFGAAQQVLDSADPINFGAQLVQTDRVLLQAVVGGGSVLPDQVVPNVVPGAPLSGTEPLIAAMGLSAITSTTTNTAGIRGAIRFTQGDHGSLLSPAANAAATAEMQGQMASMIASGGVQVRVTNSGVIRTN